MVLKLFYDLGNMLRWVVIGDLVIWWVIYSIICSILIVILGKD